MVFGSSMTDAGFSPRRFDKLLAERGIEVKSFNFGFGGLNPFFQDYLSRRIREAFEEKDRRLDLALLEFCPFQVTEGRWRGAISAVDSFVPLLATGEEMWEIAKEDPTRGVRMLNIRYLRDGISAEMITHYLGGELRPPRPRSQLPPDEEARARMREIGGEFQRRMKEDYPDYDGADWYYPWQGGGTIPEERSQETRDLVAEYFALERLPRSMENDKLNRIACCDIEELPFEELLVESYIRIVRNFQRFSNKVEVILLPRNTEWIHYSPEAQGRLNTVLRRIEEETGVTVRNFQELPEITTEMWSDTTHLARYSGDEAFTARLVEEYAPYLAGGEALAP